MSLKKINPIKTESWTKLKTHFNEIENKEIKNLLSSRSNPSSFNLEWNDFNIDISKNRVDNTTLNLLLDLAKECKLDDAIAKQFNGSVINETEKRAVLHTAVRADGNEKINVDGQNVIPSILETRNKIKSFTNDVISGNLKGYSNKPFTDVVNIGIGGSDLGPVMVVEALKHYSSRLKPHFVSNVDGDHVLEIIKDLNPETTLFVIVSKTFTTQETISNANTIKDWLVTNFNESAVSKHFAAVSTNLNEIKKFGINPKMVFSMNDWVGGRFSLWSSVGLSISLAIGYDNFNRLLSGANKMDKHFQKTEFENNIPVVLALLSIWYNNFFKCETEAVIPYTQYLNRLPAYLQQAIMESNGKSVDRAGNPVKYQTGNIIWGDTGTNSQHAFFQLIHQGTKLIPCDFIGFKKPLFKENTQHDKLMSNFFAQTEALMMGKSEKAVVEELIKMGLDESEVSSLKAYKVFKGNRPTNTLLIDQLSPESLGSLIAMYEHKIFVQGVVWNIYSYDQWGVELGKQLASKVLQEIENKKISNHDSSTNSLLKSYLSN
ncbi:MAG: glucose-6-phosphate isomerase [Flavobacteriaceae bacterium]|nr:glucose-6-phosphate isomerase [Flavobacteriaceae bacterium]MBT5232653.1 glucose-6-phosphate isomerase [Flavobacteriaceae bacterium]